MNLRKVLNRTLAITLVLSTGMLAVAPAAMARGNHGKVRYKGIAHSRYVGHDRHAPRFIVRHDHDGAGPVLAGLIGGLILGTALSNAAPPVVVHERTVVRAPQYRYWDPYCDEWFVSLSACSEHCRYEGHPRLVRVFDGYDGPCLRTLRWSDGAWYDVGDDWRD